MNRTVIIRKKVQCNEAETIHEMLTVSSATAPSYLSVLVARIAAADRGEFASETEIARFFAEHEA